MCAMLPFGQHLGGAARCIRLKKFSSHLAVLAGSLAAFAIAVRLMLKTLQLIWPYLLAGLIAIAALRGVSWWRNRW